MKISVLLENTSISPNLGSEHGLSLFIETDSHSIIFDTGASSLFLSNAAKMSVNVLKADAVVVSHGHHDHGGGLPDLLRMNGSADIYVNPFAFSDFRAISDKGEANYIGLDKELASEARIIKTSDHNVIDNELMLFSNVKGGFPRPSGNSTLYVRVGAVPTDESSDATNAILNDVSFETANGVSNEASNDASHDVLDDFAHEQNLIIREGDKCVLIAGCAHCGIVNILERCRTILGVYPDYVFGGFHLFNPTTGDYESSEAIDTLAQALLNTGAMFYTGHCTGLSAYAQLHSVMGDKIEPLSTGKTILI